jgi:rod shape-determining protein MreC
VKETRTRLLLVVVLLAQLVLLTAQLPDSGDQTSLLEGVALRGLSPVARGVAAGFGVVADVGAAFRTWGQLQRENRTLRQELSRLRQERARLFGLELELERLGEALEYAPPSRGEVRVAQVVYIDHQSWLRTLILHLRDPRVAVNQAVTSPDGLVGRVISSAPPYAKVQLITDRASSVGAMVQRTRRQGIARGAERGLLTLEYVPLQSDVRLGDQVVTAGIDGVYPRGIPLGTIVEVARGNELFYRIRLQPAVDFGVLDQVFVLLRPALPEGLTAGEINESP